MKLSIVDVSTVIPGESRHDALQHSIELARHAERLGFERIWVAEHHGTASIAGRAPEVLIAAIAAHTTTIRVGSGSVLLNHYSPFKVAEVFCTLHELYPGRIDLGAGRATTGPILDFALQQDRSRQWQSNSDQQIAELVAWLNNSFPENHPFSQSPIHTLRPGPRLHLLGSSAWSASAAAALGLRYVFAGFINQSQALGIVNRYRSNFKPAVGDAAVDKPEVILAVHAVCADATAEAQRQLAPVHVMYRNLSKGILDAPMVRPDEAVQQLGGLPPLEPYVQGSGVPPKFIGGAPDEVHRQLRALAHDFAVDEIMIQDLMTDHAARMHSFECLAGMIDTL